MYDRLVYRVISTLYDNFQNISFCRHFRRPYRTIVCVIQLINSACRTTEDALWIVTFLS